MRRVSFSAVLLAAVPALPGCEGSPSAPSAEGLEGLWNLPYQEAPALYGFVSAQMIFRPDGTFLFTGSSPLSSASSGLWTLSGEWSLDGDALTLVSHRGTDIFDVHFGDGDAILKSRTTGTAYHIFRPLPD